MMSVQEPEIRCAEMARAIGKHEADRPDPG